MNRVNIIATLINVNNKLHTKIMQLLFSTPIAELTDLF